MTYETIYLLVSFIIIQFLSAIWIKSRLESSIKHEYDRKLEAFKEERELRHKAATVAEFLAEWTHERKDTKRLNQLLWELTLYLPSKHVKELKLCIQGSPDLTSSDLLVSIRSYLLNDQDKIDANDVTFFADLNNSQMKFTANPKISL